MSNLVDRASSDRGRRRREQLIDAGIELLLEGGWAGVTTRAVAARSESNAGLIHYHFGGLPNLRLAIFERATHIAIAPVIDTLTAAPDTRSAIVAMRAAVSQTAADGRIVRLAAALVSGTRQDTALGEALRDTLRRARTRIADWLGSLSPGRAAEQRAADAVLVAALLDGLMLHRELDEQLPLEPALSALGSLLDAAQRR